MNDPTDVDGPPRKRLGRPPRISVDRIVDAAIAIIDEVGAERLSIRGVARRLGVSPMALYNYVRDREDLEGLIGQRLRERHRADWQRDPPANWRVVMRRGARLSEEIYRDHPELGRLRSVLVQANWNFPAAERLLSDLQHIGLSQEEAIHVQNIVHLLHRGRSVARNDGEDLRNIVPQERSTVDWAEYPSMADALKMSGQMDLSLIGAIDFLAELVQLLIERRTS